MLRGCLLSLLLLAALVGFYIYWLGNAFPEGETLILGAIVGLIVFFCIGALSNAWRAWGDWSLISEARYGLPLNDGRMVAVSGTIRPIGNPLIAPFSHTECVICEYDLAKPKVTGSSEDSDNTGSDYAGFLMTPSKIEGRSGEVRLLGFPLLEGFDAQSCLSAASAANARRLLNTAPFEDRTGVKMVSILSVFGEVWSDDDGTVEKHLRLSNATADEIFPPDVEEEFQFWQSTDAALEAEEDEPEDDEDDGYDDTETGRVYGRMPKMTEKLVAIGTEVCAFGLYDQAKGGLIRRPGSMTANRLLRGSADAVEKQLRGKLIANGLGGLIVLLLVHGAILGAISFQTTREDEAPPVENKQRMLQPGRALGHEL